MKHIVAGLIAGITLAGCVVDQLSEFKKLEGAHFENRQWTNFGWSA